MFRLYVLKVTLFVTIVAHFTLLLTMAMAVPFVILNSSWYVSVPVVVSIVNLPVSSTRCVLTLLENKLRYILGMSRIKGFISHYILRR